MDAPFELLEACPICPRLAPDAHDVGLCLGDSSIEEEETVLATKKTVQQQSFEKLKVLLLDLTLWLYAKCGVTFTHALTFGVKANQTFKLLPASPLVPGAINLPHYAAFHYHPRLAKLLSDPKESASDFEANMATSITLLYAKAMIPSLDVACRWLDLQQHFKNAMMRTTMEKATLALRDVKLYLRMSNADDALSVPIRSAAEHKILNETKVATALLKPATQVVPTISVDQIGSCSRRKPTVEPSTYYVEIQNSEQKPVDIRKALWIQSSFLEVLARLLVLALEVIFLKIKRTTAKLQK
ncbi:hypothetical protein HDU96_004019, partial [Phlyctochytrium bullatum]